MAKKALLVCRAAKCEWCDELFPDYSHADLPVVGKAFVEYQLDALSERGCEKVLVLDYDWCETLATHLSGGGRRRWPIEMEYRKTDRIFVDEGAAKAANAGFIGTDDVEVVIGLKFPVGDGWREVKSVKEFYDLNFDLLKNPSGYTLNGYSGEKDVYIGTNVMIKTGRRVVPPLFLGDTSRIEYAVWLMGGVIIGRGSIIDHGTILRHTIIFPKTYVGKRMEFSGKIVVGKRVIDPATGSYADLEEAGLVNNVDVFTPTGGYSFIEWLIVIASTVVFLPFYIVFFLLKTIYRGVRSLFAHSR